MPVAVTPEDFALIGSRFSSPVLINEIDRLAALATHDIAALAKVGYGAAKLAELRAYRGTLSAESPAQQKLRGDKKTARTSEASAITAGKRLLRSGIAAAEAALVTRVPSAKETEEETRTIAVGITNQLDALGGRINTDSAKLRTRLTGLLTVLARPELAIDAAAEPDVAAGRTELVSEIGKALAALPNLSEAKRSTQQASKVDTSHLNEIEGRAHENMKTLAKVGRAHWIAKSDRARAGEYQLNALHEAAPAKPVLPPPVPAPGGAAALPPTGGTGAGTP